MGGLLLTDALDGEAATIAFLGVLLVPLGVLRLGTVGILIGVGRHWRTALSTCIFPSLTNVFTIAFAIAGRLTLGSAAGAVVAGVVLQVVVSWLLIPSENAHHVAGSPMSRAQVVKACRDTAGVQIAEVSVQRADLIFLLPLIGRDELGFYAVATGVASAALPGTMAIVVGNYRRLALGEANLGLFYRQVLAASASVSLAVIAVAPWALPWIFGEEMRGAVVPTCVSAIAYIPFCLAYAAAQHLTATNQGRAATAYLGFGLAFNVLAAVALSHWGANGAAAASFLAYSAAYFAFFLRRSRLGPTDSEARTAATPGGPDTLQGEA
jgi:O-antigen/teichoic acid export membrane protein